MIDAGIVPEQVVEEFIILREEWLDATPEEVNSLRNLRTYTNQEYSMQEELISGRVRVRLRYSTPCITDLV
ncbi:hypothetical protein SEA_SCHIMMELS22_50 [Microbacterium phage Schimmels22]|jgi:hypothetical protein|nr:hypothetical protein SEA_HERCULESXL_51 [Microbacterium phage HerculesXL]WNN95251.1 hypothetical protein SEA_TINYMAN4_50 [Microbacterium phage Tinyman4]WNN96081.1 hypothetical protein SEA_SCHIMMELS22_50 [Microbacterium phage Schimmels22]